MRIERLIIPVEKTVEHRNIIRQYAIQEARWVWHADAVETKQPVVLEYALSLAIAEDATYTFHVSADERYEMYINETFVTKGPDRGDLEHWAFSSLRVSLPKGTHAIRVLVWYCGASAPIAQISGGGGFIFKAEGAGHTRFDTGSTESEWRVRIREGVSFTAPTVRGYYAAGWNEIYDAAVVANRTDEWCVPTCITGEEFAGAFHYGLVAQSLALYPSGLPEQLHEERRVGTVRYVAASHAEQLDVANDIASEHDAWNTFLREECDRVIKPYSTCSLVIDLENYYTAYPFLCVSHGKGSAIRVAWAEALYENEEGEEKGHRDEVAGKYFVGVEDTFFPDGSERIRFKTLWWRAGRYLRVTVTTEDAPLTLHLLRIIETRYPYENESAFAADDASLVDLVPLFVRGLQTCLHETYVDCPFYEQLMYVGDTRLQMLVMHTTTRDERLIKRCIDLFDFSRGRLGYVAERYPVREHQVSLTFAMIWVLMVSDYAKWKDDAPYIRTKITHVRQMLEQYFEILASEGILRRLPGWSFIDWVRDVPEESADKEERWQFGVPPGEMTDGSATVNLLFVYVLLSAARIENAYGEDMFATRYREKASALFNVIAGDFWDEERALFAETRRKRVYTEHAQCLALLTGLMTEKDASRCFNALTTSGDLSPTSYYFSFYLLECFYQFRRGDLITKKVSMWDAVKDAGCRTTIETPLPTRSDCHAWGAHPLHHYAASLLGVRPDGFGFKRVRISPAPFACTSLEGSVPHAKGMIHVSLSFDECMGRATITLPKDVAGVFSFRSFEKELVAGSETTFSFPCEKNP